MFIRRDNVDQVNRSPRDIRIRDQDRTHRNTQIVFQQLLFVVDDDCVELISKSPRSNVPLIERREGSEVRVSTLILVLLSPRNEVKQEDFHDMLKSCLMTHSRYQGEVFCLNFGVERVLRDHFSNHCAMPALAPHVADFNQRVTVVYDSRKLEPRLDRSALAATVDVKQQAVQPTDS